MISQKNISPNTPMGASLVSGGGATFRAWAPLAAAVYLNGTFGGTPRTGQTDDLLLAKDASGYWTAFANGHKRDPYARELKQREVSRAISKTTLRHYRSSLRQKICCALIWRGRFLVN
jgi:1,4-alpha-glucan branching enzyme